MIDIHSHILPGIDDGAPHQQGSLKMAQVAADEGVTQIIATPHYNESYKNTKSSIIEDVARLNEAFKEEDLPLEVLAGQEPRIFGEFLKDYEENKLLTLNDAQQFILVELPHESVPRYTSQLLYDIQLQGLTPVIVHPERNRELIQSPDLLYKLVKNGALTQITASSVTGHFGKQIMKFTYELIESNLTHFVASDAHNTAHRTFRMKAAFGEIEHEFGIDYRYMLQENAELLIAGQNVMKEVPERIKKKKFMGLF